MHYLNLDTYHLTKVGNKCLIAGSPTTGTPADQENGGLNLQPEWSTGNACALPVHSLSMTLLRTADYKRTYLGGITLFYFTNL